MNCLKAQSEIIAYIDNKLEKEEKKEFLEHVTHCEDCKEELNIYYTMIEGMRQMDQNLPISRDFSAELDARIARECRQNKNRTKLFRSSVCLIFLTIIGFVAFGYINYRNIRYMQEQAERKEQQGEYYFSDTFDGMLFTPGEDENILNISVEKEKPELSFYEKVQQYQLLQK